MKINKGLVLYYSATGNTKTVAEMFDGRFYDVYSLKEFTSQFTVDKLNEYDIIALGMSTWQRGMPPKLFQKFAPYLTSLPNKKTFYLFGSGREEYKHFCGALDLYNELLTNAGHWVSEILKYEGYPSDNSIIRAKKFLKIIEAERRMFYGEVH